MLVKTEGIILRITKFGESSLICKCFSKELGVISVMAKGVRKAKSSKVALFQLLSYIELSIYNTKEIDSIKTIKDIRWIILPTAIVNNPENLNHILTIADILNRTLPENYHNPELFDVCVQIIEKINDSSLVAFPFSLEFTFKLIFKLGLGFDKPICNELFFDLSSASYHNTQPSHNNFCRSELFNIFDFEKICLLEKPNNHVEILHMLLRYISIQMNKDLNIKSINFL